MRVSTRSDVVSAWGMAVLACPIAKRGDASTAQTARTARDLKNCCMISSPWLADRSVLKPRTRPAMPILRLARGRAREPFGREDCHHTLEALRPHLRAGLGQKCPLAMPCPDGAYSHGPWQE